MPVVLDNIGMGEQTHVTDLSIDPGIPGATPHLLDGPQLGVFPRQALEHLPEGSLPYFLQDLVGFKHRGANIIIHYRLCFPRLLFLEL